MSLLVAVSGRNNTKLIAKLTTLLPEQKIIEWREGIEMQDVEFVLAWNPPPQLWQQLPNLKAISSYGAGVDSLLSQAELPSVPIARIVDPDLADNMSEYVLHAIGHFKLRFNQYLLDKVNQTWRPKRASSANKVGILGLGQLGQAVAKNLVKFGFEVNGWSRSQKSIAGIECFSGQDGLATMLSTLDYVVCLLPLTKQTHGMLNKTLFDALPKGAVLINVARGAHVNEEDCIAALEQGQLGGAALDVFTSEPLPQEHPFWQQPQLLLTPHVSAVTSVDTACEQIADNYLRMINGEPLLNVIDRELGY